MKYSPDNKVFDFHINWASITAFAAFWTYGYYGAVSFKGIGFLDNIFISVVVYGVFLLFLLLSHYYKEQYMDILTIRVRDIVVFLSFLVIMFALSSHELSRSLVDDQLAHSQESQRHMITVLLRLSSLTSILSGFVFANILFFMNILSIGIGAALYLILKNRSFLSKVIALSVGFFVFRVTIVLLGSYATPHPPFRLFPLWLSSSLLSSTDFSFRLPQFLGLVVFMWVAQRIVNKKLTFLCSWLFGLAVGTIPLLWHVGTMAEQSVWTAIVWSVLLLSLAEDFDFRYFKWIRWFSLVSLFAMLRQPAFLALLPLCFFYIFYVFRNSERDIKRLSFTVAPVLLMLPFIIKSIIAGTPASYIPGESSFMPSDASGIQRVWFAVSSGIAPWIIWKTVMLPWAIFPFFAFLPHSWDFRRVVNALGMLVFFVVAFATFYTIRTGLWGVARYQAEYIIPFGILGLFCLLLKLKAKGRAAEKILVAGLVVITFNNVITVRTRHNLYKSEKSDRGVEIRSESGYNYRDALKAIRSEGYAGHTYIVGITYGILPEIMNGFTTAEVLSTKKMQDHYDEVRRGGKTEWTGISPESVNVTPEIKMILISDIDQSVEKMIQRFQALGWKPWRDFKDARSGTVVYGMLRGGL